MTKRENIIARIVMGTVSAVIVLSVGTAACIGTIKSKSGSDHMPSMGLTAEEMCGNARRYTIDPSREDLESWVKECSIEYAIRPSIVCAIIERESNWQIDAYNDYSGATGLMQLMPGTFEWTTEKMGYDKDILNAFDNIEVGIYHLGILYEWCDNRIDVALDAYANGYSAAMRRYASMGENYKPCKWTQNIMKRANQITVEWCKGDLTNDTKRESV